MQEKIKFVFNYTRVTNRAESIAVGSLGEFAKFQRFFFSIGVSSQAVKSCFTYTPRISLLYDNIGEIIVSNILQSREGFSFSTKLDL